MPSILARGQGSHVQDLDPDTMPREEWQKLLAEMKAQTDREHDEVTALGGLHIVATERHESRRIDNQLRGRAGRPGDPGASRFFLSLQDDLMRIFGGEKMQEPHAEARYGRGCAHRERGLITRRIAKSQEAVEAQNFGAAQGTPQVRRRQQQAAAGGLRHAPATAVEGVDQERSGFSIWSAASSISLSTSACPDDKHPDTWDIATPCGNRYPEPVRREDRSARVYPMPPATNSPTTSSNG